MQENLRRHVAFIIGRILSRSRSTALYDFQEERHFQYDGQLSEDNISIYDYTNRCYLAGRNRGKSFALAVPNTNKYILFRLNRDGFNGLDENSGFNFSGVVRNKSITLFDFETQQYHNYSV